MIVKERRMRYILGAMAALALSSSVNAHAPEHVWQYFANSGDAALFADDATVRIQGDVRWTWVTAIVDPKGDMGSKAGIAYFMALHRNDCAQRTDGIDHITVYYKAGGLVRDLTGTPEATATPMSTGEGLLRYVCEGVITTDKVEKITDFEVVKETGLNIVGIYRTLNGLAAQRARQGKPVEP
jgi:hypothetical protein